jgi:hypothetical protein
MQSYRPTPFRRSLAQQAAPAPTPSTPAPAAAPAAAPTPAPAQVVVPYTEYSGVPGFLETVAVLAASGAAAWVGVRTGMKEKQNKTLKAAGWIGGVGSAVLGLLYLGQKSGMGAKVGLPAVRVTT